jgi:hypothetical protein
LPALADSGYEGAGHGVYTPTRQPADGKALAVDNRAYNLLLRSTRCLAERGFALLTQRWRTLQHTTASPSKIGDFVKAGLVLTHFEHRTYRFLAEITSLAVERQNHGLQVRADPTP